MGLIMSGVSVRQRFSFNQRLDQFERENEEALFFKVKGIEQDFALLHHFLVLRQIAREHYMPSEVQDEPQHGADVDDDIEYIGGGHTLPLAHQNGQCSVPMDVPASQMRKLQEFPRFVPPKPCGTRGVVWEDGIGPGFGWEESRVE
jgi:hypothetical protein